ncbi:MAG: hypothetical protein EXS17_04265 [Phycisphaerales bacterium]|nr:hypothetical protein [Phycisphaerales bacterium]
MFAIVLTLCLCGQAQATSTPTLWDAASLRFGQILMREAYSTVTPTDLAPVELEAAIFFATKSALLAPNDPIRWRMLLGLSGFAGDIMPAAVEAGQRALEQLTRLEPADEVIRLRRLLHEIGRYQKAEETTQVFKRYLTPETIKIIGVPVASRLSFDLALLELRMGDVDAFGRDLAQALALSPSFPAAAETAAGFANERLDDPVAEAELLVTAILANPIEERMWGRLGALLMQEGAYGSAARVYQLAALAGRAKKGNEAIVDLIVTDQALALWASGRADDAVAVLQRHIAICTENQTVQYQMYNPTLTRAECVLIPFMTPPLVAVVDAAIKVSAKHQKAAAAIARMIDASKEQAEQDDPTQRPSQTGAVASIEARRRQAEFAASGLLDTAMTAALIGADAPLVQGLIDAAEKRAPLNDDAKLRISAWMKMKAGDGAGALAILDQSTSTAPAAQFMRAKARAAAGNLKDAARGFFAIATSERGNLIGILAAAEFKELVGADIPARPSVASLDGIVASIPPAFEQYLAGSTKAFLFQVIPEKIIVEAFDPIRYRLIVTNQSDLTMAVALGGPIKQNVLLQPRLNSSSAAGVERLLPQIIPFDRAIQLAPSESMEMLWDMSFTEVGFRLNLDPIAGSTLSVRGALNFNAEAGSFNPGTLGASPSVPNVEVAGVRVNDQWIDAAIARAAAPETDEDLRTLVLLIYAAKSKLLSAEQAAVAWKAITDGFAKLPAHGQAWVLLVGPRNVNELHPVLELARATTSGDVRGAYLLNYCISPEDPQLAAALRSDEPFAKMAHSVIAARFQREAARADERMRGERSQAKMGVRDKLKVEEKRKDRTDTVIVPGQSAPPEVRPPSAPIAP